MHTCSFGRNDKSLYSKFLRFIKQSNTPKGVFLRFGIQRMDYFVNIT